MKTVITLILCCSILLFMVACSQEEEACFELQDSETISTSETTIPDNSSTEPTITEPTTFIENSGIVLEREDPDLPVISSDEQTIGVSNNRGRTTLSNSGYLQKDLTIPQVQSFIQETTVVKYYGDGMDMRNYNTTVNIEVGETYLNTLQDYESILTVISEINGEGKDTYEYAQIDSYYAKIQNDALQFQEQYPNHKIVSCSLDFDWGAIDNYALWEETGDISVNIGFALIDKYSGIAFAPETDNIIADQLIEINGENQQITFIATGKSSFTDNICSSQSVFSAIVPVDYDGVVFAVGDGAFVGSDGTMDICDFTEHRLYSLTTTHYYAAVSPIIDNAKLAELTQKMYAETKPLEDSRIEYGFEHLADISHGRTVHSNNVHIEESVDGLVSIWNWNDLTPICIYILDSNYNIISQTGLIPPDGVLNFQIDKSSVLGDTSYAILYFDDNQQVSLVEMPPLWTFESYL